MSWDRFDRSAVLWVSKRRTRGLSMLCAILTASGHLPGWLLLAGVSIGLDAKGGVVRALWPVLPTWILSSFLKGWIQRPRPWQALGEGVSLELNHRDDSFPSSHAATVAAFSVSLLLQGNALAPWILAWACGVIFSRLYRAAHFPSDLLGGAGLGSVVAAGFGIF